MIRNVYQAAIRELPRYFKQATLTMYACQNLSIIKQAILTMYVCQNLSIIKQATLS